mmetsp:Transcript_32774/g.72288  ORF Transcript_32774/g.72288 Transcript_32774/m.72288 type:complete len:256 (+) Transcript_32774:200-967(+)
MKFIESTPLFLLALLTTSVASTSSSTTRSGTTSSTTESPPTSSPPIPFAPPSPEFCDSNEIGDDVYLSFFVPCDFTFYAAEKNANIDHFACDSVEESDSAAIIKEESRKVMLWPDSCVANGPRCYSITDYPNLYNFTIFEGTDYAMKFPPGANVVSVDCSADFEKVQEFVESLPEEFKQVAEAIGFAAFVVLFAVLAAIVACICCCCGACGKRNPSKRYGATYVNVPPELNEPVVARLYQPQPHAAASFEKNEVV